MTEKRHKNLVLKLLRNQESLFITLKEEQKRIYRQNDIRFLNLQERTELDEIDIEIAISIKIIQNLVVETQNNTTEETTSQQETLPSPNSTLLYSVLKLTEDKIEIEIKIEILQQERATHEKQEITKQNLIRLNEINTEIIQGRCNIEIIDKEISKHENNPIQPSPTINEQITADMNKIKSKINCKD
jgi:hypothetical protein